MSLTSSSSIFQRAYPQEHDMKMTIIDNSLCDSDFRENINPAELVAYIEALHEFGAGYIELVTDTFVLLPPGQDLSKIILRVTSESDLLYLNSFDFGYALLPANMTELAPKISRPVISEISLHGSNPFSVINMFISNFDLSNVAMIRLLDDFNSSPWAMTEFVKNYRAKYAFPLDICPTNGRLNAASAAVAAVIARADCVTMRFGSYDRFAELQDYTMAISSMFSAIPSPDMIVALCKCAVLYKLIYGRDSVSATKDMRAFQIVPHRIPHVDGPVVPGRNEPSYLRPILSADNLRSGYIDPIYKKLVSMQVDSKNAKELESVINQYCTKLFKS